MRRAPPSIAAVQGSFPIGHGPSRRGESQPVPTVAYFAHGTGEVLPAARGLSRTRMWAATSCSSTTPATRVPVIIDRVTLAAQPLERTPASGEETAPRSPLLAATKVSSAARPAAHRVRGGDSDSEQFRTVPRTLWGRLG